MTFTISPIKAHHIAGFREALDKVAKEKIYLAFLTAPSIDVTRQFILNNIAENHPQFVALINNQVVAWCDITPIDRPVFSHVGVLGIGVVAEHRGQGIGKALLQVAINAAKNKSLKRIELQVRENNHRAIALYQQLGFKIEGLHINAVLIDQTFENQLTMALLC